MPSNSEILAALDELIAIGSESGSPRVKELTEKLRSSDRVAAHIENETRRDLVMTGRQYGNCEICGGQM